MNFVNEFVQEHGYSPSVREIGEAVGLRSTASVSYHLQALQAKGILGAAGQKGRKRALAAGARPGQIPIVGVVTAGMPILAVENQEGTMAWDDPGCFALRVRGDSMNAAGVDNGDEILVREQPEVENGQIAVVLVNGDEATVKYFRQEGDLVILTPKSFNPEHQPQIYDLKRVQVRVAGLVVECRKVFRP